MFYNSGDKEHGIVKLFLAANYMDIPVLRNMCILRIMYGLKGRSKEEMMEYFKENGLEPMVRYIGYYDVTLSDWIDKWSK